MLTNVTDFYKRQVVYNKDGVKEVRFTWIERNGDLIKSTAVETDKKDIYDLHTYDGKVWKSGDLDECERFFILYVVPEE